MTTREYNPVRRTFYDVNYMYSSGYVTKTALTANATIPPGRARGYDKRRWTTALVKRKQAAKVKTTNLDLLFLQNKDAGDSDSEKEQEELNELENLLKKHDPDFSK